MIIDMNFVIPSLFTFLIQKGITKKQKSMSLALIMPDVINGFIKAPLDY